MLGRRPAGLDGVGIRIGLPVRVLEILRHASVRHSSCSCPRTTMVRSRAAVRSASRIASSAWPREPRPMDGYRWPILAGRRRRCRASQLASVGWLFAASAR
jgi:hypothetical protein